LEHPPADASNEHRADGEGVPKLLASPSVKHVVDAVKLRYAMRL